MDDELKRIDELRQQFPDDADMALKEARAVVDVIQHASDAGDWERVDDMFKRIESLRQQFPDSRDIALEEVDALIVHGAGRMLHEDAPAAVPLMRRALELKQKHLPPHLTDKTDHLELVAMVLMYEQACAQAGQEPDWQGLEHIRKLAWSIMPDVDDIRLLP